MIRVTLAALLASTLLVSPVAFAQESAVDARLSTLVDRAASGELAAVETELDALSASTNPDLLMAVGDLWKDGLPEVPPLRKPQLDRAADVYRRAAAIPGNHQGRAVFEQARIAAELGGDSADDLLVQAASLGYARALIVQAEAVLPVSPDSAEALGRIAYSLQEPDAALLLARLARGADKSDEAERLTAQAISWLQPKAEAGDASAMENLGEVLIRQGDAAGREWLEQAAATQSGAAKTLAALSLQDDPTGAAALAYFEIATGHGDIDAARKIALLHFDQDRSGVSEEVARDWLEKTVQIGDVRGHILAAQIAGSQDEARALLATAETLWRGDPEDAYQIGRGYDPDAAAGNDAEKAIYWYEQAMAIGSDRAVLKLADLLVKSGTDPNRAAALLEKAADSGSIDAKAKLGLMRMEGPLNMRDLNAAADLLLEAAEGGSMTGINAYARALDNGVFGPPDKEAAIASLSR